MTLMYPMALFGLLAAVTPIVIYLLLRRRKHELAWGASYLLRLTLRSRRRSSLWKQMIVLACRCLLLALAAVLLVRAWRGNPEPDLMVAALPEGPVHRVVLYDTSLSMSARDGGESSRASRQRAAIGSLLRTQRPGDHLTLVPLMEGDDAPLELAGRVDAAKQQEIATRLQGTTEGMIRLRTPLAKGLTALAGTPDSESQLFIFSDFPRELSDSVERLDWLGEAIDRQGVTVVPVDLSLASAGQSANVVITDLELGTDAALVGLPMTLYIVAESYSDVEQSASFEVTIDGEPLTTPRVAFSASERRRIPVSLRFDRAGPALVRVTTEASRLPTHGSRHLAITVQSSLKVWLIADDTDGGGESIADTEFFMRGVDAGREGAAVVEVKRVTMSEVSQPLPAEVDVVVLAAPTFALPAVGEQLEAFVRRGGGLVFTSSSTLRSESYNVNYGKLLPAPLMPPARESVDPAIFALAQSEALAGSSPLFREFGEAAEGDFAEVRYYNYLMTGETTPESGVVFRLSSDDPLLLVRRLGRGHVYLLTTTLGIDWSSLPVRQAHLPFVWRLLQAASAGRALPRNLEGGSPLVTRWPSPGPVQVEGPDGARRMVEARETPRGTFVESEALTLPGYYVLTDEKGNREIGTVRKEVQEGDLRPLEATTRQGLTAAFGVPIHAGWEAAVLVLGAADATWPLWPWIVVAMLLVYMFECWFVRLI